MQLLRSINFRLRFATRVTHAKNYLLVTNATACSAMRTIYEYFRTVFKWLIDFLFHLNERKRMNEYPNELLVHCRIQITNASANIFLLLSYVCIIDVSIEALVRHSFSVKGISSAEGKCATLKNSFPLLFPVECHYELPRLKCESRKYT